jgi:hypothetical protein
VHVVWQKAKFAQYLLVGAKKRQVQANSQNLGEH